MSSSRHTARGYTLVEVLAAMAVLGAGLLGIIAMQGATVSANQRAQEITMATNLARRWQDRLRRDAIQWNSPSQTNPISNLGDTWYLRAMLTSANTGWFIPQSPGMITPVEYGAFDYFGRDVEPTSANVYYCTHARLTRLIPDQLIRAEVRVWWYRQGGVRPVAYANCGSGGAISTMGQDTTNVRWVYVTQTLTRHEP